MFKRQNSPIRSRLFFVILLLIPVLVGCVSRRNGVSWPNLTIVEQTEQQLMVSYEDFMVLLDPVTGLPIQLTNSSGGARVDEDGNPLGWEIDGDDADGARFYATPLFIDDETLLVANYNEGLITANFPNSRIMNPDHAELPGHVFADMVVSENILYVPLSDLGLVALDYNNPTNEIWRFEVERGIWSAPVVVNGVVYVGSIDHNLYALDAQTGDEIWTLNLGGAIASSPLHFDGHLYIGTLNHDIYDISLNGEILGDFEVEDWIWNTPVVFEGVLYVADLSGWVYALDISSDMSVIWRVKVSDKGIRPSPVVTEDYVIVADREGHIFWLQRPDGQSVMVESADGLIALVRDVDAEVLSDMVFIDFEDESESDLLIVSTTNKGKLITAFTIHDGERRWGYSR